MGTVKYFRKGFLIRFLAFTLMCSVFITSTPIYANPTFPSAPVTTVEFGDTYTYNITPANGSTLSVIDAPSWLSLEVDGSGPASSVSTLFGDPTVGIGRDGDFDTATLFYPRDMAYNAVANDLYITDHSTIRKVDLDTGQVSTLAGVDGSVGSVDGSATDARFYTLFGIVYDESRNSIYTSDGGFSELKKIDLNLDPTDSNYVSTLVSGQGFNRELALDTTNDVLYGVQHEAKIGKIELANNNAVTTVVDNLGYIGGLAMDSETNTLYQSNYSTHKIVSYDVDNNYAATELISPFYVPLHNIYLDESDNSIYTSAHNSKIYKFDATTGESTHVAGDVHLHGSLIDSNDPLSAGFYHPQGMTKDADGNLYVVDIYNKAIRKIEFSDAFKLTGTPDSDAPENNNVTLRMTDSNGDFIDQTFNLTVDYSNTLDAYGFFIGSGLHQVTGTSLDLKGFDKDGNFQGQAGTLFNLAGFNRDNFHSNGSLYDNAGFDFEGNNSLGFNVSGIHKDTGTLYDASGLDNARFDANGDYLAQSGVKFDTDGYNQARFDAAGFNVAKLHQDTGTLYDLSGHDIRRFHKDTGIHEVTAGYFNAEGRDKNDEIDLDGNGDPNWQQAGNRDDMDGDGIINLADKNMKFARTKHEVRGLRIHINDKDILDFSNSELHEAADKISEILGNGTTGVEQKRHFKKGSVIIDIETLYTFVGNDVNILSDEDLLAALLADPDFTALYGTNITLEPLTGSIYYDETGNTLADSVMSGDQTFYMSHKITRQSSFKVNVTKSIIDESGTTSLGTFSVRNNTKDGFSLKISTLSGGTLTTSSGTEDGEVDIDYDISIVKVNGVVGNGMDQDLSHPATDLDPGTPVSILSKAGSTISSETNITYELLIDVDSSNDDTLTMAGTYDDTITLTYEDL